MNYENLLSNFPKRNDLWNVYLDMEIKYTKDIEYIRYLFQKICQMPHKPKMAKSFLKKYSKFESEKGDQSGLKKVKILAEEYVKKINLD